MEVRMKKSYLIILGSVLLILAGIYFYQQRPVEVHDEDLYSKICPSLKTVDELMVWAGKTKGAETLHIKKNGQGWWVDLTENGLTYPAPAKAQRVENLFRQISSLQGEIRAQGKDILDTFYLKDDQALHLVFKNCGQEQLHLLVGKRGPRWDSCFVRKNQNDTVYLVPRNLLGSLDIWDATPEKAPDKSPWVELAIINQGPAEIEGISYSRGSLEWSLVQNKQTASSKEAGSGTNATEQNAKNNGETGWILTLNGRTLHKKDKDIQKLLSTLFPLRAEKIVPGDKAKETGLGPGDQYGRFTVHLKGRGMKILHVGAMDKEQSCGWIRDDRGVIFKLQGKIIETINHFATHLKD